MRQTPDRIVIKNLLHLNILAHMCMHTYICMQTDSQQSSSHKIMPAHCIHACLHEMAVGGNGV